MIAVKTSIGHERTVADALLARAKARDLGVFSILVPAGSRGGYIYVEAMNPDRLEGGGRGSRRARGGLKGEGAAAGSPLSESSKYPTPKPPARGMIEGGT